MSVFIYNRKNITQLPWQDFYQGEQMRLLFAPMIDQGLKQYVQNAPQEIQLLALDQYLLPLVVSHRYQPNTTYICSPISQYFDLALEEIKLEMPENPTLSARLAPYVLGGLKRGFVAYRYDRLVMVNNWLLSTNLYPALSASQIREAYSALLAQFPSYAIMFRSVNELLTPNLFETLKNSRFRAIVSRPVLYLDTQKGEYKRKRMFKSDQKLWKKSQEGYYWEKNPELSAEEQKRVLSLYQSLYLDKYSSLNPQYTPAYLEILLQSGLLDFHILKKEGTIFGVTAFFKQNGQITTPFIGYDREVPLKTGLYRFLNLRLMEEAISENLLLNMSSGAANFKKMRGGEGSMEYNMVFDRHLLPAYRRPWQIYELISDYIAVPEMRAHQF